MRRILVVVLRLLFDPESPQTLRGSIVQVPEGTARPFADGDALLEALNAITRAVPEEKTDEPISKEGESEP